MAIAARAHARRPTQPPDVREERLGQDVYTVGQGIADDAPGQPQERDLLLAVGRQRQHLVDVAAGEEGGLGAGRRTAAQEPGQGQDAEEDSQDDAGAPVLPQHKIERHRRQQGQAGCAHVVGPRQGQPAARRQNAMAAEQQPPTGRRSTRLASAIGYRISVQPIAHLCIVVIRQQQAQPAPGRGRARR